MSAVLDEMRSLSRTTGHGAIFGVAGFSGSGKTTLAEKLIRCFCKRNIEIAVVKHAHRHFEADHEGKDSYRLREAGSRQVMVSSIGRSALFAENKREGEPSLTELLHRLEPATLVLVEGFKKEAIPKLEVWREANHSPLLFLEDKTILAMVSDDEIKGLQIPRFNMNETQKIADFIISILGRFSTDVRTS
jgi:molybdopterin-guanine dinucleotide biosynthesis protein B